MALKALMKRKPTDSAPAGSLVRKAKHLERLRQLRRPTLLRGPTGCGKTTVVEWLAARHGQKLETAVASMEMVPADLLGRWMISLKASEWHDNALSRAVREGSIFYFDEMGSLGEDVLKVLYPLLDHRRELVLNAKEGVSIKAHPEFWFVGAYNPPANLPAPFRQRCAFLEIDYLDEADEIELLTVRTGVQPDDADFLVRVARLTRTQLLDTLGEPAGTRLLLAAAEDLLFHGDRELAVEESILSALTDDREARLDAMKILQAAGLFSADKLRQYKLRLGGRGELPVADNRFFDEEAPADKEES